ncbi:MAG: DsbA family protein [Candidatus Micrarchaeota archaeon]|nr:DsbA family protein [Candidatus Micrarchaeota archaeon]
MGDENNDSVTLSKGTIYGVVIAVLAILLIASVFTGGFGIVKQTTPPVGTTDTNGTTVGTTDTTTTTTGSSPVELIRIPALPGGDFVARGNNDSVVSIIEFSDFQCPYCGKFYNEAGAQMKTNYVDTGKAKLYFRDYPLPFHPNAEPAAGAARCANEQGKFWEYHDKLFVSQNEWSNLAGTAVSDKFKAYATSLNLNADKFASCISTSKYKDAITADAAIGQQYGVQGTPAVFIVMPKTKAPDFQAKFAVVRNALPPQYQTSVVGFEDDAGNYGVLVSGAFPYATFKSILDIANN